MIYLDGGQGPTFRHTTFGSAEIEAERLSKETGQRAFILKAIAKVQFNQFVKTKIDGSQKEDFTDDLPF